MKIELNIGQVYFDRSGNNTHGEILAACQAAGLTVKSCTLAQGTEPTAALLADAPEGESVPDLIHRLACVLSQGCIAWRRAGCRAGHLTGPGTHGGKWLCDGRLVRFNPRFFVTPPQQLPFHP